MRDFLALNAALALGAASAAGVLFALALLFAPGPALLWPLYVGLAAAAGVATIRLALMAVGRES